MAIEDIQLEYAEISPEEGEKLLYQVYELLLSNQQEVTQIASSHTPGNVV